MLYRLPEVIKATGEIWIPEGEKDADTLAGLGFTATTNPLGAGKWRTDYNEHFRGKQVVIIPDNDKPGHGHADAIARSINGIAASVKVLTLPNEVNGAKIKDATDFVSAFKDKSEGAARLRALVQAAAEYRLTPMMPTDAMQVALADPRPQAYCVRPS